MSEEKPKVGFVGVGLMGHGMAKHILKEGFQVSICANTNRKNIDSLVEKGANEVKTLKELAANSDVIFLCVSNSEIVDEVIFGKNKLLAGASKGTIFVDTSTSRPERTVKINVELRDAGMLFADAPLTRSPAKAEEGELGSFVSCEASLMKTIEPIVQAYSEEVLHVGEEVGMAHKLKLMNNFISGGYVSAWSESYNTCMAAGIDPKHLHAAVSMAGLNCLNFQNYSKFVIDNDPNGHKFATENLLKDIRYYIEFAEQTGTMTNIADQVRNHLKLAVERGYGKDFATVLPKVLGEINNKPAGDLPRGK